MFILQVCDETADGFGEFTGPSSGQFSKTVMMKKLLANSLTEEKCGAYNSIKCLPRKQLVSFFVATAAK